MRGTPRVAAAVLAAGAVAVVAIVPLFTLAAASFHDGWQELVAALADPRAVTAGANTLRVAVAVTVLSVVGGVAAALFTERGGIRTGGALRAALVLPVVVPPFVAALSWVRAYARGGLTDDLIGVTLPGLFGAPGIVAVLTVHSLPLVYLIAVAGLRSGRDWDAERAARISGATPATVLRTVTLPLLRPAVVAGAALVFVTTVNAFGVPAVLGTPAGFATVTTRIYADLALAADPAAFTRVLSLSVALVVVALVAVGHADVRRWAGVSAERSRTLRGESSVTRRLSPWVAVPVWLYAAATTFVPLLALIAVASVRAVGLSPVPSNLTLQHYVRAMAGAAPEALGNSLLLAAFSATAAIILAGLLTILRRGRGGTAMGTATILPFALPGSALAVAVLLAYGGRLRDSLVLIAIAYVAKFAALAHRPLLGAVDALPPDSMRAARASGATGPTVVRTILVPLLRPAVVVGWLLVFLFALHEVTMSSLLYGPGSKTLAVVVLNLSQLGNVSATSALAVLLTAGVVAVSGVVALGARRARAW